MTHDNVEREPASGAPEMTSPDVERAESDASPAPNESVTRQRSENNRPVVRKEYYSISEVADLNIVSVVVPPLRDGGRKTAILNLATIDPRDAIQALGRAGFPVGWPSLSRSIAPIEEAPLPQ